MRTKFLLPLILMLSACGGGFIPVRTEYRIVKPDQAMYRCETVVLPDPSTLTDVQVASLLNDLYANNRVCRNNMEAIQKFLETAEKILAQKPK